MKRRTLVAGGCAIAWACRVLPQTGTRLRRLGFMRVGVPSPAAQMAMQSDLRQALAEAGYSDGNNIDIDWRWIDVADKAEGIARELMQPGAELIIVHDTPAAHAARRATQVLPIVLAGVAEPVATGLAGNLARPEGNVTGLSWSLPAVAGKKIEMLKEMAPGAQRFGFLGAPQDPAMPFFVASTREAGKRLGVDVLVGQAEGPAQFAGAFAQMARGKVQAVVVQPLFAYAYRELADRALREHMLSASAFRGFVLDGGTLAYGPSSTARWRRVAHYVDRLLRGARPGDLPIEDPSVFSLVVNLKSARALGITVPQAMLLRADELLQ